MLNSNLEKKPILYSFRRCPYAIRARLLLAIGNCYYEHREIDLKNKASSLLRYSPKGTVPVLVYGKEVIEESMAIVKWCLDKLPDCKKLQMSSSLNPDSLIFLCDHDFKKSLDIYKYSQEDSEEGKESWAACKDFLCLLDRKIGTKQGLLTPELSYIDYAIFPFVRQCKKVRETYFNDLKLSSLKQWLEKIENTDLFTKVMEKHPLYSEPSNL